MSTIAYLDIESEMTRERTQENQDFTEQPCTLYALEEHKINFQ